VGKERELMFVYEKKLQYPINIKTPNAKAAKVIMTQLGGPDGELGASLRYLSQRYTAPYGQVKALLTDIGTEELGHVEMIGTLVYQLTRNLSVDEIKAQGFDDYFVDQSTYKSRTNSETEFLSDFCSITSDYFC
jgi:spore coat protein JC